MITFITQIAWETLCGIIGLGISVKVVRLIRVIFLKKKYQNLDSEAKVVFITGQSLKSKTEQNDKLSVVLGFIISIAIVWWLQKDYFYKIFEGATWLAKPIVCLATKCELLNPVDASPQPATPKLGEHGGEDTASRPTIFPQGSIANEPKTSTPRSDAQRPSEDGVTARPAGVLPKPSAPEPGSPPSQAASAPKPASLPRPIAKPPQRPAEGNNRFDRSNEGQAHQSPPTKTTQCVYAGGHQYCDD